MVTAVKKMLMHPEATMNFLKNSDGRVTGLMILSALKGRMAGRAQHCANNHNSCKLKSAVVISCLEDSVPHILHNPLAFYSFSLLLSLHNVP